MVNFLADNFPIVIAILILALCPCFESKIAIPCALSTAIWGSQVLSPLAAFFVAFFGSMIACLIVLPLAKMLKKRSAGFVQERFFVRFQKRHEAQIERVKSKNTTLKKCVAVATFVAVPLPMTGVWTGSFVAGLTDLKWWQCALSVAFGEAISCAVVLLLCVVFENSAFYIFLVSLVLVVGFLLYLLTSFLVQKVRGRREEKRMIVL